MCTASSILSNTRYFVVTHSDPSLLPAFTA